MNDMDLVIKKISASSELANLVSAISNALNESECNVSVNNINQKNNEKYKSDDSIKIKTDISSNDFSEKKFEALPLWVHSLETQHQILEKIKNLSDIAPIFGYDKENNELNMLSFIVISSQWTTLVNIWQACADQCKKNQEKPADEYFEILNNSLYLYNLTLSNNKASLKEPVLGEIYDYKLHFQLSGCEKSITKVLLPALYTASNELFRNALVIT